MKSLLILVMSLWGSACQPHPPESSEGLRSSLVPHVRLERQGQFAQPQPGTLPFFLGKDFEPVWLRDPQFDRSLALRIPEFQFWNQQGQPVSQSAFFGKITVANFFFTGCSGYCPAIMRHLLEVQKAFREDPQVLLLSHSVTPALDTPPRLRSFGEKLGIVPGKWHLVTGPTATIYDLARHAYYADTLADPGQTEEDFLHAEHIYLLDTRQYIRGVYNGNNPNMIQQLIEDLRVLKQEF